MSALDHLRAGIDGIFITCLIRKKALEEMSLRPNGIVDRKYISLGQHVRHGSTMRLFGLFLRCYPYFR
jgi:hypothetical protein